MKKIFKLNNIKYKLILSIVILLIIVLTIFSFFQLRQEKTSLENELASKIEKTTATIAHTSVDPIWEFNYQSLENNIDSFLADREIIGIEIKDDNDNIIALAEEENPGYDKIVEERTIVNEAGNRLGVAQVEFTDYYVQKQITASRNSLLILTIILCILSTFVIFILSNITLDPIIKLTNLANKMADGNLDVTFPTINAENEVAKLSKALNKMNNNIKKIIARLQHQAFHDYLTKLPNRRKFLIELKSELNNDNSGAVFLLDLNNFKEINDVLGHIYGDRSLEKVGQRLLELDENEIFVARYGGDEFLLLVKKNNQFEYLKQKLKQIEQLFDKAFKLGNDKIEIDYNLGVARYPDDGYNTFQLITRADTAMYQAKQSGKKYLYYDNQMIEKIREKKQIKEILKQALTTDDFALKYQPQVNLNTGNSDCLEALLRLKNHNISPAKFIPIAEESNLIIEIGRWVTKEAIKQLVTWKEKGLKEKTISINFSVKQLRDEGYINFLVENLNEADIEPELIEIEITESILLKEKDQAIEFLSELKNIGVSIALDDFGTGYSSLNYLTYIQLDRIKLDRSLSNKFLQEDNLGTINSLIGLFHNLNLPVVAEGIETTSDYEKLTAKNCDYIQGYLFSKPLPPSEIEQIYDKNYIAELN